MFGNTFLNLLEWAYPYNKPKNNNRRFHIMLMQSVQFLFSYFQGRRNKLGVKGMSTQLYNKKAFLLFGF
jgi:hypothetical protein